MVSELENNKQNAIGFYDLMFNENRPKEAVEKYVGAEYIQHNPAVANGKKAFIDYFEKMAKEFPNKKVYFKKVLAEGEFVIIHCHQVWPECKDRNWAGIDIFRFDDQNKIVEHWDVLQVIPTLAENTNTMFWTLCWDLAIKASIFKFLLKTETL